MNAVLVVVYSLECSENLFSIESHVLLYRKFLQFYCAIIVLLCHFVAEWNTLRITNLKWNLLGFILSFWFNPFENLWFQLKIVKGIRKNWVWYACVRADKMLWKEFEESISVELTKKILLYLRIVNGKYHKMMTMTKIKWKQALMFGLCFHFGIKTFWIATIEIAHISNIS